MDGRDPIAKETRDEAARWYAKLNNTTITTSAFANSANGGISATTVRPMTTSTPSGNASRR